MNVADQQFLRAFLRIEMLKLCATSVDMTLDMMDEENWQAVCNHRDKLAVMAAVVGGTGVVLNLTDICDEICGEFLQQVATEDRKQVDDLLRDVALEYKAKKGRKQTG